MILTYLVTVINSPYLFHLFQNLSERKKKAAEEKRQLEDELDDVKTTFEVNPPHSSSIMIQYHCIHRRFSTIAFIVMNNGCSGFGMCHSWVTEDAPPSR